MKGVKGQSGRDDALHPHRSSIFIKLLAGYLALSIAVTVLATLTSYLLLRRYAVDSTAHELLDKAHVVANLLSQTTDDIDYDSVRSLEALSESQIIYINDMYIARHIPHDSAPTSRPSPDEPGFERTLIADTVDRSMAENILGGATGETDVRYVAMLDCRIVFAGAPVRNADGEITGALLLYRRLDEIRGVAISTVLVLAISLAASVLISMLWAYIMSLRITDPLNRLNRTARHIAQGHYGEVTHLNQDDEIGQLGHTLNDLSRRLGQTIFDLQNEKAKLEQILSGIGEGIVAVDQSGSILHHNAAALELLGLTAWQARAEEEGPRRLTDMLFAAMANGQRAESRWTSPENRCIKAVVWPFTGAGTKIIGAVALLSDVSEAERLEQLRRDYVANVSHELRTPLTGIRGMVEPLMDGVIDTEPEKMECYRIIYQETMRLEKLIGEMLDMSRLQSDRIEIELEPLALPGILEGAVRRLCKQAESCHIALHCEYPENLPPVMGNEDRIMQVLIILMDNALSFTPEGGEIVVFARAEGDHVAVGVRDNGAGISPTDLPYIWERFYKADKSRMRTTGTGLGLSIAKLVCEHMKGTIGVQSEVGKGATFTFTLEIAPDALPEP